jgi:hypothetical protein
MSAKPTYIQHWVLSELRDNGAKSARDLGVQITIFERLYVMGYAAPLTPENSVFPREAKWQITDAGLVALGRYKISARDGIVAA